MKNKFFIRGFHPLKSFEGISTKAGSINILKEGRPHYFKQTPIKKLKVVKYGKG